MEELIQKTENEIKSVFEERQRICEFNEKKVLTAFINNHISEAHLNGTTGYGYGDIGREAIENIFAEVFKEKMELDEQEESEKKEDDVNTTNTTLIT